MKNTKNRSLRCVATKGTIPNYCNNNLGIVIFRIEYENKILKLKPVVYMADFLVWQKTSFNLAQINRVRSHTGK